MRTLKGNIYSIVDPNGPDEEKGHICAVGRREPVKSLGGEMLVHCHARRATLPFREGNRCMWKEG